MARYKLWFVLYCIVYRGTTCYRWLPSTFKICSLQRQRIFLVWITIACGDTMYGNDIVKMRRRRQVHQMIANVSFWYFSANQDIGRVVCMVVLSDLRFIGRGFQSCLGAIAQWSWASYLHLCASVTKQYNLVPIKGRWRSEAGKVTVGLATHWPSQTLWFIHLRAQGPRKGDKHLA